MSRGGLSAVARAMSGCYPADVQTVYPIMRVRRVSAGRRKPTLKFHRARLDFKPCFRPIQLVGLEASSKLGGWLSKGKRIHQSEDWLTSSRIQCKLGLPSTGPDGVSWY